jgi:glycosyltransferase involved in cell wall biosynthesis
VALSQGPIQETQRERLEQVCASAYAVPEYPWTPSLRAVLTSLWRPEPASVRATWNPEFAALVRERAAAIQPELVIAFQVAAAPYARMIPGVPRVLEELEVAWFLEQIKGQPRAWRRLRPWLTWYKQRDYLLRLLRDFDACTVVSRAELAYVRSFAPAALPVSVIPNGADVSDHLGAWGAPEPDTLIYPGALSYDVNFDAMAFFLSNSFPLIRAERPQARIRITGKADPAQRAALPAAEGLEFTGYVPDVRPLVARSWCEVVPLRQGGGTRLKVLEALALGTPVIATSKGIEGLDLQHEQHVLIADNAADFARATLRLLSQPDLRARLSAAGHQLARARYDWRAIGQQLNDLLRETAAHSEKLRIEN